MSKVIVACMFLVLLASSPISASECGSILRDSSPKELLENGYCDKYGYYYPSLITPEAAQRKMPDYAQGIVTWVNPHRMEDTAAVNNIDLSPFKDGLALMSCSDVGETVWLKRPDHDWDGPFVVADCANPVHMFAAICYKGEIAELGFKTAVEWGLATYMNEKVGIIHHVVSDVIVAKSAGVPSFSEKPIDYRSWWLSKLTFVNGQSFQDMGFEC